MNGGVVICGFVLIGLACILFAPAVMQGIAGASVQEENPSENFSLNAIDFISIVFALLGIVLIIAGFFI